MGWGKWALAIAGGLVAYETVVQLGELSERHRWWRWARAYANSSGKPLLRIGVRRSRMEPPNGDVTLDIDPAVLTIPGGVLGDERAMPFTDKQFSVCFNEHTIEHLHSPEDVQLAVRECARVADYAVILTPSPYSLFGLLHYDHYLRIWLDADRKTIHVAPNPFRTPLPVSHPQVVQDSILVTNQDFPTFT